MRTIILLIALSVPGMLANACTAFVIARDGHTLIGNNEDAWSINAQVRFEQGRDGGYGSVLFGHFNGHPFREMVDQIGMNEAGLVFDGLGIARRPYQRKMELPLVGVPEAMSHVMNSCATVHEAAAYLRTVDLGMSRSMLFLADRNGDYLIVEPDTLFVGHDPWYAVGNWPMSTCGDPASIPIPRLQSGRAILAGAGEADRIAQDALEGMIACRKRMGEGTLFSTLFDPAAGLAHLWFYHDFAEGITFNLKDELPRGDRTVDMASLFGPRPEFDALKRYATPFHQRWLFWALCGLGVFAVLVGAIAGVVLLARVIARMRRRSTSLLSPLLCGISMLGSAALIAVLLTSESVFYFGLRDLHWAAAALPIVLIGFSAWLIIRYRCDRKDPWLVAPALAQALPVVLLCVYWRMLWP